MNYVLADNEKPKNGVDVLVITESGVKGTAKWWEGVDVWLSNHPNLKQGDRIKKWKYANAKYDFVR